MNKAYKHLLEYLMPSWDSDDIDVELRLVGIIGKQGSGKTTLAMTIANDLYEKYRDSFACLHGYWLHKLLPKAIDAGVLRGKKHILIVIDDATALLHTNQSKKMLSKDYEIYWRLRHYVKDAGAVTNTAKVVLMINMHSYMSIAKYLRNVDVLIIKSVMPRWQRYEREDVSLRWFDAMVVKLLTRMRSSIDLKRVTAALSKAVVAYDSGASSVIIYRAKKQWSPGTFIDQDTGTGEDSEKKMRMITQKKFIEIARECGVEATDASLRAFYKALFKNNSE